MFTVDANEAAAEDAGDELRPALVGDDRDARQ